MIKALSEILVEIGMFDTQRKASSAIGRGDIYVEGLRVANKDALLVITAPTVIEYRSGDVLRLVTVGG